MTRPCALPRRFYSRHVLDVARDLLGCVLVHDGVGGRIVEVEAYGGEDDPGSHGRRGPRGRAALMYGPPGIAYVYFTYGMHFCLNAVTDREGTGSAVLFRAVEPLWGIDLMRAAGAPASLPDAKLASGPGRLCRALRVGRAHHGVDLTSGSLRIARGTRPDVVHKGARVGLTNDDGRTWRLWTPSPALSRPSR